VHGDPVMTCQPLYLIFLCACWCPTFRSS
jgi:hypothetical protein